MILKLYPGKINKIREKVHFSNETTHSVKNASKNISQDYDAIRSITASMSSSLKEIESKNLSNTVTYNNITNALGVLHRNSDVKGRTLTRQNMDMNFARNMLKNINGSFTEITKVIHSNTEVIAETKGNMINNLVSIAGNDHNEISDNRYSHGVEKEAS